MEGSVSREAGALEGEALETGEAFGASVLEVVNQFARDRLGVQLQLFDQRPYPYDVLHSFPVSSSILITMSRTELAHSRAVIKTDHSVRERCQDASLSRVKAIPDDGGELGENIPPAD